MPTVRAVTEPFSVREASLTLSGSTPVGSFTRVLRIELDSGGPGADVAASKAPGLPALREPHPYEPAALANSIRLRPESNDDKLWLAEILYTTDTPTSDQEPENPLDEPPRKSWSFAPYQRPLHRDITGQPIINTAREQFDPLPEVDDNRIVLRYTRNLPGFNVPLMRQYRRAVNSDNFLGWPPRTVRVSGIQADEVFTKEFHYWTASYEFQMRGDDAEDDWKLRLLNQGFRQLTGDDTTGHQYETILDKYGVPLNQPALLDLDGLELVAGEDPIFLEFEGYFPRSFSVFGIS